MKKEVKPIKARLVNLKQLREATGKTQSAFANELGFKIDSYRAWEQLRSCPEAPSLIRLAEHFETSIDFLFGRPGYKK
jgi:DNA-binding transcriptional regulator YiaG